MGSHMVESPFSLQKLEEQKCFLNYSVVQRGELVLFYSEQIAYIFQSILKNL